MIRLTIPYPKTKAGRASWSKQFGLNAIYAGKHWSRRKQDSEYWHMIVAGELRKQGIAKQPAEAPVSIRFCWNDRLDLDNHAYMRKMIIDALKGWVIKDDDRRYISAITDGWHDGDCIIVEVTEI